MTDPLAALLPPKPVKPEPQALEYMPARLVVMDDDDPDYYEVVEISVRVTQMSLRPDILSAALNEGEDNLAAYYLAAPDGDSIEIKPEWVGKSIVLEVAPSLIKGLDSDLVDVCDKWDATSA